MKKNYLTLVVIIMTTTLFAQNKKEQIATLTSQIDSLNAVVLKERASNDSLVRVLNADINVKKEEIQSLNTDINVKKEEIQSLNTSLAENQKQVSLKDSEILLLQEKMKWAMDSMNVLVQMLEPQKDSISSISIEAFRQVNRNNINEYNVESFMEVFQGLETRYYVDQKYMPIEYNYGEDGMYNGPPEAYFEIILDNRVVVLGYISSDCFNRSAFALNFQTIDGYCYLTQLSSGSEPGGSFDEKIMFFGDDSSCFNSEFHGTYSVLGKQPGVVYYYEPGSTISKELTKKLKSIPKTFKLTKTKPAIMDCVYIEGFNFE